MTETRHKTGPAWAESSDEVREPVEIPTNPEDLAIVRAIIGLAEAFGLELVAEGVETAIAAQTLMQYGCHRAQGFLLSRPVAAEDMESLLSTSWMPMACPADSGP